MYLEHVPQSETLNEFPMNRNNVVQRLIHDLYRTDHNALGINIQSLAKPEMLWYHLLHLLEESSTPITKISVQRRVNHKSI